ncbi:hypothetical protein KY285_001239 [Solanum tuberosum]|nr:hypothetical protein KY285_001239 [Solanum tuberosum]
MENVCFMALGETSEEPSKKTYRKGMWVLDNGCSRHMCENKEIFKTIKIWGKERELSQAQNA